MNNEDISLVDIEDEELEESGISWGEFFDDNVIELQYGKVLRYVFSFVCVGLFLGFIIISLSLLIPSVKSFFGLDSDLHIVFWILLALVILFSAALVDLFYSRVIIQDKRITYKSILGIKSLSLDEIKGYDIIDNYIIFYPKDDTKSNLKITQYFKNDYYLSIWAEYYLNNFSEEEKEEEVKEVTQELGIDENELESRISKWRTPVTILNVLAFVCFFTVVLFEKWILAIGCVLFLSPIIFYLILKKSNGAIKFYSRDNSIFPSLFYAILGSGVSFAFASSANITMISSDNFWIIPISIGILSLYVFRTFLNDKRDKKIDSFLVYLFFAVCSSSFAFGYFYFINSFMSNKVEKTFTAKIQDKYQSSGKSKTCHFNIPIIKEINNDNDIQVPRELFKVKEIGDSIHIRIYKGNLGLDFYKIGE